MKNFLKEFKTFIQKGNVLDLAVGMIIGTAFNTIVKSLVNDIIMPLISVFFKVNVVELNAVLVEAVLDAEGQIIKNAVTLNYGIFLQSVLDFLIIALSVFVAIKVIVKINKKIERLKNIVNKDDQEIEEASIVEEVVEPMEVIEESDDKKILNVLVEIKNLLNNQDKTNNE